jgi:hypothetical protein
VVPADAQKSKGRVEAGAGPHSLLRSWNAASLSASWRSRSEVSPKSRRLDSSTPGRVGVRLCRSGSEPADFSFPNDGVGHEPL